MAIDTKQKRFSMMRLASPRAMLVPPSGSVTQADRQQFLRHYTGITWTISVSPDDDDTKDGAGNTLVITSFTARDGTKLRAPRITLSHAINSAANVDLHGPDRTEMDRFKIRSDRHRLPNMGRYVRVFGAVARAGEAFVPRTIVLDVSLEKGETRIEAADTTSKTARDGTKMTVPEIQVMHAADSFQNANLKAVGTAQDRFTTRHAIDKTVALGTYHRLLIQGTGRAGSAGPIVKVIVLDVELRKAENRTKARST